MRRFLPIIGLFFLLAACKKEKEVIIPDNTAPPDSTITDLVIESYVNRSYIVLLGHKPDDGEMAQGKSTLRTHNVSQADRETFLEQVIAKPDYAMHTFDVGRSLLINSTDTSEVQDEIFLLDLILADSAFLAYWPAALIQRAQLEDVLAIPDGLAAGTVDLREMHRRLVTNKIYDQINMGTQNFVISMFQNFLSRYPTATERATSELMVDGFPSTIFLENGRSKTEFISIFLNSRDYDEGQVRDAFNRYLYREPHTEELETLTLAYRANHDYKALQKAVLSEDEFVGI
jgi:hypothetical protein